MTLPAVDSWDVRGLEGPDYKVGPRCSNPNCGKLAEHAHHIIRRSQLVKEFDWISIDGHVIGNKTGLCVGCHDDITGIVGGHKAAIRWETETMSFWWCLLGPDLAYILVAPLAYQPPTPDALTTDDSRATDTGPETCPFCGHEQRRRSTPTRVGRRRRKSWTVLVPDEELEQGADVLDSLIDNLAPLIPNADASATGRYYVIVAALAHSLMDSAALVASIQGRDAA